MSVSIFASNLLETATVSVSPSALATRPITRTYDRLRGLPYEGGSAAQTDLDIDLGATPGAVTTVALLGHNITGVTVSIRADTTSPGTTQRATIAATGADVITTFASLSLRYWRLRIPAMASAPQLGEVMLGVPRTIATNPFISSAGVGVNGSIDRRKTPGGYVSATRLGPSASAFTWHWTYLTAAEVTAIKSAYSEAWEGAKPLLVADQNGVLYWMAWTAEAIAPVPVVGNPTPGSEAYELDGMSFVGAS